MSTAIKKNTSLTQIPRVIRPRTFERKYVEKNIKLRQMCRVLKKRWRFFMLVAILFGIIFMVAFSNGGHSSANQETLGISQLSAGNQRALISESTTYDDEDEDPSATTSSTNQIIQKYEDDEEEDDETENSETEDDSSFAAEDHSENDIDEDDEEEVPVTSIDRENQDGEQETSQSQPIRSTLRSSSKKITLADYFGVLGRKLVNIEKTGSYKFVMMKIDDTNGDSAYAIHSCSPKIPTCKHPDAVRAARSDYNHVSFKSQVLGGGRMTVHRFKKPTKHIAVISIFGYSRTYGRCEHCNAEVCALVAAAYPQYLVRWSNTGYHESDERSITDFVTCNQEISVQER